MISRRELYAFGEPFGECATHKKFDGGYVCGGGGGGGSEPPPPPPPTPEEIALRQAQIGLVEQQTNLAAFQQELAGQVFAQQQAQQPLLQAEREAQLALIRQQTSTATEMLRRQNLLEPAALAQQGFQQILDASGNIIGYQPTADKLASTQQSNQIATLMRTRTLAALNGELPVDPALERAIATNRRTLQGTLEHNLGTGYATSSPGIEALADFDKRSEELRQASRQDQLRVGEGIRLSGESIQGQTNASTNVSLESIFGAGTRSAGVLNQAGGTRLALLNLLQQDPFGQSTGNIFSQQANTFSQASQSQLGVLNLMQQDRTAQIQANAQVASANAQAGGAASSAGIGLFGDVLGAVIPLLL